MTGMDQLAEAARLETARLYARTCPDWYYPKPATQAIETEFAAERHLFLITQEATA